MYHDLLQEIKKIAFGTLKGGPGKTATLFNTVGVLAETELVLAVDADPQFNLTTNAGIDVTDPNIKTLRDVFENGATAEEVIIKSPISELPNLDILPSSIQLTATEIKIVNLGGREQIFNNFLIDNIDYLKKYKYIFFDTNPNLGMINQNIFNAADSIVLVSDISSNSIMGAEFFIALWETIRWQLRKSDNVAALILNNADFRTTLTHRMRITFKVWRMPLPNLPTTKNFWRGGSSICKRAAAVRVGEGAKCAVLFPAFVCPRAFAGLDFKAIASALGSPVAVELAGRVGVRDGK